LNAIRPLLSVRNVPLYLDPCGETRIPTIRLIRVNIGLFLVKLFPQSFQINPLRDPVESLPFPYRKPEPPPNQVPQNLLLLGPCGVLVPAV
jgi:hypothetical protein